LILNFMLKKWFNFYNIFNSFYYKNIIKNILLRFTWKWAKKKHNRYGQKLIVNTYFLRKTKTYRNSQKNIYFFKFKNIKWVFYSTIKNQLKYNKLKIIYLLNIKNYLQLLSNKYFILPKNLLCIYKYYFYCLNLIIFNYNFRLIKLNSSFKQRLL
jgi:hypothetical protein